MFSIPPFSFKSYLLPIVVLALGIAVSITSFLNLSSVQSDVDDAKAAASTSEDNFSRIQNSYKELLVIWQDANNQLIVCGIGIGPLEQDCTYEEIVEASAKAELDEQNAKLSSIRANRNEVNDTLRNVSQELVAAKSTFTYSLAGSAVGVVAALGFVFFRNRKSAT